MKNSLNSKNILAYRYTQMFSNILRLMGEIFKAYFSICIALITMKLTYVLQISKNMLPTKNGINTTNILYTGSYKIFPIL